MNYNTIFAKPGKIKAIRTRRGTWSVVELWDVDGTQQIFVVIQGGLCRQAALDFAARLRTGLGE